MIACIKQVCTSSKGTGSWNTMDCEYKKVIKKTCLNQKKLKSLLATLLAVRNAEHFS